MYTQYQFNINLCDTLLVISGLQSFLVSSFTADGDDFRDND